MLLDAGVPDPPLTLTLADRLNVLLLGSAVFPRRNMWTVSVAEETQRRVETRLKLME